MAIEMDLMILKPDPVLLLCAVILDGLFGDPVYALHPIRLMGATLSFFERVLRRLGLDGYVGGCFLFVLLAVFWLAVFCGLAVFLNGLQVEVGWIFQVFVLFSLIALKDLCKHGLAIDRAAESGDVEKTRYATSMLVGRDTSVMDEKACRRAAMESLSENAVDGFVSPIFWYAILGLPGIVLFKVISTMDSMVGFKTERYFYFGWCGARLDDVFNFLPARLTYVLMIMVSIVVPKCSARKALVVGWQQHARVPGPNSGWSEATAAGALQLRLVGPIWNDGKLVTEVWLGDLDDPEGGRSEDVRRMCVFVVATCLFATALAAVLIYGGGLEGLWQRV